MPGSEVFAEFSFKCTPKNSEDTFHDVQEYMADRIPENIPSQCLYEYIVFLEQYLTVHDIELSESEYLQNVVSELYHCPVVVHYADGRCKPRALTVDTGRAMVDARALKQTLAQGLQLRSTERVILGMVHPKSLENFNLIADQTQLCMVYGASLSVYVAYIVEESPYYAVVTLKDQVQQNSSRVIAPPVIVPLTRPPDLMTFSTTEERHLLFDDAMKPFKTSEAASRFDYAFSTVKTSRSVSWGPVHEYKVFVSPDVMRNKFYKPCESYDYTGISKPKLARSLWKWSRFTVRRHREGTKSWESIKSRYLRRTYYGEAQNDVVYNIVFDPCTGMLHIKVSGNQLVVLYYPPSMIHPEASAKWEFSRLLNTATMFASSQETSIDMATSVIEYPMETQPPGVLLSMNPHQLESLGYMTRAEEHHTVLESVWTQLPVKGWYIPGASSLFGVSAEAPIDPELRGGFLSDSMGFGKTCELIALCLAKPCTTVLTNPTVSKSTLVMCPASLLHQWNAEIQKVVGTSLKVLMYHGRQKANTSLEDLTRDHDIVLMSYNTYVASINSGIQSRAGAMVPFTSIEWHRVICDESHTMSETAARFFPGSKRRWMVSATPIKNMGRQLMAFGVPDHIRNAVSRQPIWATYIAATIMCRHTPENTNDTPLPPVTTHTIHVDLTDAERALYEDVRTHAKRKIAQDPRAVVVMNALQGLRSVCAGGTFTISNLKACFTKSQAVDPSLVAPDDDLCPVCMDAYQEPAVTRCNHWFCRDCIETSLDFRPRCPMCRNSHVKSQLRLGVTSSYSALSESSDMDIEEPAIECRSKHNLLVNLVQSFDQGTKTLVFATSTMCLEDVQHRLKAAGLGCVCITGSTEVSKRSKLLSQFASESSIQVCILTLRSAAVGLNLTTASNVVFLDAPLDPEMITQGVGRVWRQGQTKHVNVYHLVAKGTIEECVHDHVRQTKKRPLKEKLIQFM